MTRFCELDWCHMRNSLKKPQVRTATNERSERCPPSTSLNRVVAMDIRRICTELLDLKDAVENLRGNMQSKYLGFLRISEEVVEVEQELIELQKHASVQGILVQDLLSGVFRELEIWNECQNEDATSKSDLQFSETDKIWNYDVDDPKATLLENLDILLVEHKIDDVLLVLYAEEKSNPELSNLGENQSNEGSSYREAFLKRKEILKDLLVGVCEQPYVRGADLRNALSGLVKLGKVSLAHQLLLKAYGDHLQKKIEGFLPSCLGYTETFAATLSQFVFSTISLVAKESALLFGDMPVITNRIVQWAEYEIESFVRLVRENSPPSETYSALRSVSLCVDAGLRHCSILETKGLKFSKLLMVLLRPQIEEILDMNFRRVRRKIVELVNNDEIEFSPLQPRSPTTIVASSNIMFISSGRRLMCQVEEMLGQLTPKFILYYGGTILNKLLQLFAKYVDVVIKALPGTSEDDNAEHKESVFFKAETDAEQLALLGTVFTVADDWLPMAVTKILLPQIEKREEVGGSTGSTTPVSISALEYKDWRRHLQHSFDELRDYFCRQYVLTFIYSREGKARMDAHMYLEGKGDDLFWDSDALPSLPFQALFARLQQLVSVTRDVLHRRDKLQKNLLSRLTETVVMWLSEEQEFWDVFEDETIQLQPFGLQQLILDMHFIAEITGWGGYPSRNIHQLVSAIITRAIGIFSERGVDPQNALPEDEWFTDTAKAAINKLLGPSASDSSEVEADEHLLLEDEISDAEKTPSSPSSTTESSDSFASANMGETETPVLFSDPET